MFRLSSEKPDSMVSHFAIPSKKHLGGTLPYVFTEHGVLQLANILRSDRATQMSIKIIEVFVAMWEMQLTHKDLLLEMEVIRKRVSGKDEKIQLIFDYLKKFIQQEKSPRDRIGFQQNGT